LPTKTIAEIAKEVAMTLTISTNLTSLPSASRNLPTSTFLSTGEQVAIPAGSNTGLLTLANGPAISSASASAASNALTTSTAFNASLLASGTTLSFHGPSSSLIGSPLLSASSNPTLGPTSTNLTSNQLASGQAIAGAGDASSGIASYEPDPNSIPSLRRAVDAADSALEEASLEAGATWDEQSTTAYAAFDNSAKTTQDVTTYTDAINQAEAAKNQFLSPYRQALQTANEAYMAASSAQQQYDNLQNSAPVTAASAPQLASQQLQQQAGIQAIVQGSRLSSAGLGALTET
jgi:hypothetical protein